MSLGFSVYLSRPFEEQHDRVRNLVAHGFDTMFTSLHIPEDDVALYAGRLQEVGAFAKEHGLRFIADVSTKSLQHLDKRWDQAQDVKAWGVTGLRIDYGIEPETIVAVSTHIQVVLNASTLTAADVSLLKGKGLNPAETEVWHNFYPRPETGLAREDFREWNEWLKDEGFQVMAFVPGDEKRGPLYEGLPTIEEHRGVSPFAAWLDLTFREQVPTILVGDVGLEDSTLEQFQAYREEGRIVLRAKPVEEIPDITCDHQNRKDAARDCLRSEASRSLYGTREIAPRHTLARPRGTITIDNQKYGRYQGEVQVTKRDLARDDKVNVLGRVIDEDLPLLSLIGGGVKFTIRWS
ncbi:DUF871 domain-containing protein [Shouchella shacheensis]|uniref:DUF871 domain-containing protein n=1 Tax=Shouchella shacheensis TaxID=1649580 RepID=UPI0007404FE7|nr:MupG family TIM beta-alpha barrel fold protein [Shouchella shacheensis]